MARKQTPSSIDRLPRELRELIGELRRDGRTIDEILEKLRELDANVSRSALGRHVKSLGEIAERMQRSRQMAEALVNKFGDQPDNKLARINLELMHTVVMETIIAAEVDPETGEARSITFSPEQAMFLARAMQSLASAEKATDDRIAKAVERAVEKAKREAAKETRRKLDAAGRSGQLDRLALMRAKRVLGFDDD